MSGAGMVIIGAGECGARAAFALRENGYEGSVTLLGSETHLPYERPPLSKSTLVNNPGHKPIAPMEKYRDTGIDVRLGVTAEAIVPEEHKVLLVGGDVLPFEKLLIATGARPRRLPETGPSHGRVKYLRTFDDAVDIRSSLGPNASLAIVGAGFIGLELAATARALGTKVTVIEAQPRVLMRGVPEAIAEVISARHRAEGVDLRCGVGIAAISEEADGVSISLADGSTLRVDAVVVGIGAVPNTSLAEVAGIQVENGIAVDEQLRTSAADVYAAGDCCSFPLANGRRTRLEAWKNAQDQGNLAAKNMLGGSELIGSVPYFWSDQYDLTLQVTGLADGVVMTVRREIGDDAFILFHLGESGVLLSASGIGRGNVVGRDIKLSERLIAAGAKPDAAALASSDVRLKSLLAA